MGNKKNFPRFILSVERVVWRKGFTRFRITANARWETKPKGPVGAEGCREIACGRFGQRKGQGWRSSCKPQPLATVRIRARIFRVRRKKAQVLL